jgi:hypothetical protein
MGLCADLIPKIKDNNPLRNPITTTVDQDFVDCHLFYLAGGRGLRMDNLDDAVVKLLGFRDLDRTCLFGNA